MKKLLLILIVLLCSGCYDYRELNDLVIISGIGISRSNDEYEISYEIVNTSNSKEEEVDSKTHVISAKGKTIKEAIEKADTMIDKSAYFEHLKICLITKDVNILDLSDYILRNNLFTTDFYLVLTDNPKEILEFKNPTKSINSNNISNLLKNIGYKKVYNYFDYQVANLMNNRSDIILPSIVLEDDITISNYGIYNGTNFVRYLTDKENKIYSLFIKDVDTDIKSSDNIISIYGKDIKKKIYKDKIELEMVFKARVEELGEEIDLRNIDIFDELNDDFSNTVTNEVKKFIDNIKKDNSDILGFKNLYYFKFYKDYDKFNYSNIPVNVKVSVKVLRAGLKGGI